MIYPLDHARGFAMVPRDAASFEPLIQDAPALQVYMLLMCRARSTPRKARGSHGVVELQAGQCLAGRHDISEQTGLSASAANRALMRLEGLGLIARTADKRGTVITMLNYGDFADVGNFERTSLGQASDKPRTSLGQASDTNDREIRDREIDPESPYTPHGGEGVHELDASSPATKDVMVSHERAQDARGADLLPGLDLGIGGGEKRGTAGRTERGENEAKALAWALVTELNSHLPRGQRRDPTAKYMVKPALALVRAGHTADEARLVAKAKAEQWKADESKRQYLRPSTLLAKANFQKYLAEDVPRIGSMGVNGDRSVSSAEALAMDRGCTEFDV